MNRWLVLLFGVASYVSFLGVFLYAIGFVGGFLVPTQLDELADTGRGEALLINLGLLAIFAIQHSVMARPQFKRIWTRVIPVATERSFYVLCSNLALALLFWQWRPLGGVIWEVEQPAARILLWAVCAGGWLTVLVTTFLINHFDLFGLRQVWCYFRGRRYEQLPFVTPGPYRWVRHPLYVGWLLAFWATPLMTLAHLVFALTTTLYILVAIQLEERDLVRHHGDRYREYRRRVPMLVPRWRRPVLITPASTADHGT
ncbi:MAG: isoprenylcysteine carboxylmethyltransferase family protein [Planctomycetaceae bacterium]|nr:MAG: isoprenylcysteine carboxylmethyltransferase family protein [Planctomycetaceae bacterium]